MKKILVLTLSLLLLCCAVLAGSNVIAEETAVPETTAESSVTLEEAMTAYRSAKTAKAQNDLESELKDMVAQRLMTQEQADVILKACADRAALREGVCPNCGYEFETTRKTDRGMRGNGMDRSMNGNGMGRGMRGGKVGF